MPRRCEAVIKAREGPKNIKISFYIILRVILCFYDVLSATYLHIHFDQFLLTASVVLYTIKLTIDSCSRHLWFYSTQCKLSHHHL